MYYAVRVGKTPGIYESWEECSANVIGVAGAQYKKFKTRSEAEEFMIASGEDYYAKKKNDSFSSHDDCGEGKFEKERSISELNLPDVYAFVDGSFNASTKVYGYGGFVSVKGAQYILQGSGDDSDMASMRNVAGELLGATAAIQYALDNELKEITILYDYKGIELWALELGQVSKGLGEKAWKTNKAGTLAYREFVSEARNKLDIKFVKVEAHTGIPGNEEADRLAKESVGIV